MSLFESLIVAFYLIFGAKIKKEIVQRKQITAYDRIQIRSRKNGEAERSGTVERHPAGFYLGEA
ncbi:MAG: hypothetical protein KGY74_09600 [Candidatus Cloacimonetes bacterium]|nr:hypothetical protein [Candidatus Cloacimonadota bacterium]